MVFLGLSKERFWCLFIPVAVSLFYLNAHALNPTIGVVKDTRTTGDFFSGLDVELKLIGDAVDLIRGYKVNIDQAVDSTGKSLLKKNLTSDSFQEFGDFHRSQKKITLKFLNPSREAKSVKSLKGTLNFFIPSLDKKSVVRVSPDNTATGKPILSPTLKNAQIEIKMLTAEDYKKSISQKNKALRERSGEIVADMGKAIESMFGNWLSPGENDLIMKIKDPKKKVVNFVLRDNLGKKIENEGTMSAGDIKIIRLGKKPPSSSQLDIQILTSKSLKKVPFSFKDVLLP